MKKEHGKNGFTGQIGFVMAAAGSAVGVGNLWRFPYLAAKDGGGLFILIYLILAFTFGFTLLTGVIFNFIMGVLASRLMLTSLSKFKCFQNRKLYGGAEK